MRLLAHITIALLIGCVMQPVFCGPCAVYEMPSGKAKPIGLVRLPPELETNLRSLIPDQDRNKYVCWYVSGERLIAAKQRNPDLANLGYVFINWGNAWTLSSIRPIILPRTIQ